MSIVQSALETLQASKRLEIEQSWQLFLQGFATSCLPIILIFQVRRFLRGTNLIFNLGLIIIALIAIFNYLGLAIAYPSVVEFADPAEANVASVAWLFQNQQSLYPTLDAAERYINNYGAFLYIIHGFFLNLLKPSFFSVKLVGSIAGVLSLFLMFLLLKQGLKSRFALIGCGCISLCLLALTSASGLITSSLWVRPDSLLLFCTTLGLVAVVRGNRLIAIGGSAIALGISTNLKITAFLNFLPIYVLLLFRFGILSTLFSLILSALVALLPFFIFPNISLTSYWAWLQQVRLKGINNAQIIKNLLWMGYVSLPIAIGIIYFSIIDFRSFLRWLWQHLVYILSLSLGIVVVAILGATRGALENNMLPFIPLLVYLSISLFQQIIQAIHSDTVDRRILRIISPIGVSAALSFVLTIILAVYSTEIGLLSRFATSPGSLAVQDMKAFMDNNSGKSIAMGYGSNYPLTTYRPALVFAGNPYLLDSASLMEMQASGMNNTPDKTLDALKTCRIQIWLIPKNQKPFDVFNYYPPLQKLFSTEFRETFLQHYDRQDQTEFYDAWYCKNK
jgi:hypothetical protein